MFPDLATPTIVVDLEKLETNIAAMQAICDDAEIELRPHIKTHKMVEVAQRQLQAGAAGLTCAKIGEAEALLPAFEATSGRREIFIAHSLADPNAAPRLQSLHDQLDELMLACTSIAHAPVLENLVAHIGLRLPVMMALDSGLGREGARDAASAVQLAQLILQQPHLELHGFYTHEGHFYGTNADDISNQVNRWYEQLSITRQTVEAALHCGPLRLWPGCSVSAKHVAGLPGIDAVRPGSYIFGDLSLTDSTSVMAPEDVALTVLATVIDRPEQGLALLDCGSKTLSSDRTPQSTFARSEWGAVTRVSEEHGFLTGSRVEELKIGDRIRLVPAHVCPVVNLTDSVVVVRGAEIVDVWHVVARGKVQ